MHYAGVKNSAYPNFKSKTKLNIQIVLTNVMWFVMPIEWYINCAIYHHAISSVHRLNDGSRCAHRLSGRSAAANACVRSAAAAPRWKRAPAWAGVLRLKETTNVPRLLSDRLGVGLGRLHGSAVDCQEEHQPRQSGRSNRVVDFLPPGWPARARGSFLSCG